MKGKQVMIFVKLSIYKIQSEVIPDPGKKAVEP
jgi:hypothetical protein